MTGIDFIRDLAVVLGVAGVVGWLCQRIGLSLVVGYLAAGAIIGPFTPPFQFVTDLDRVQVLAQVGLVFLIFSIGLDLSFARLRRMGFSVIFATVVGAVIVFNGCRLFGAMAGWTHTQSLFLAGMLMVSSSAIISKVLQELNAAHRRDGQLALGITVMEDTVAVVMLTVLSTLVQLGGQQSPSLPQIVGSLTAFIVFLVLSALFFVPRLLLRLSQTGRAEVRMILVLGLLLSLAWLAQKAGYSMALGAFLLGVVVASTPQKVEIERGFEGLRDMFGAVFFVAMGMLVDFRLLVSAWPLVLAVAAFALVLRTVATTIGLVVGGNEIRESIRAGLALTPLGEFSFIAAQMGVAATVIPPAFFPMAVGASLLTTLASPFLMRRSDPISAWVDNHLPLMLREWIAFYQRWLEQMISRQQRSLIWRLSARRLVQISAGMFLISALILFVRPAYTRIQAQLGDDWIFPNGTSILFWAVFGVLVLAPLVAIWRNIETVSLIISEWVTKESRRRAALQPLIERALRGASAVLLVLWLLALMPFGRSVLSAFVVVLGVMILMATLLWRRLVFWQSKLEIELRDQLQSAMGDKGSHDLKQLLEEKKDSWQLQAEEYILPDFSARAGRPIREIALRQRLGCSIASIDRHGIMIVTPSADVVLYPHDKLLLLGSAAQIDDAIADLGAPKDQSAPAELEDLSLETLNVPEQSPAAGKSLVELDLFRKLAVQIAGIQRGADRILTPNGRDTIQAQDELLVLGTPRQILEFETWLTRREAPPEA